MYPQKHMVKWMYFHKNTRYPWIWCRVIKVLLRIQCKTKSYGKNKIPPAAHPIPPHPTPPRRFQLMLWRSHSMLWAFPVTGRSHGLAAAPGHGQVARVRAPQVRVRPRSRSSATWPGPGAAARPWERPVTGNAITLNGNAGVGWGGLPSNFEKWTF